MARRTIATDMIGQKFGLLAVLGVGPPMPRRGRGGGERRVYCRCDCGTIKLVKATDLRRGARTACDSAQCLTVRQLNGLIDAQSPPPTPYDAAIQTLRDAGGYGGKNNRLTAREVRFLRAAGYLPRRRRAS